MLSVVSEKGPRTGVPDTHNGERKGRASEHTNAVSFASEVGKSGKKNDFLVARQTERQTDALM